MGWKAFWALIVAFVLLVTWGLVREMAPHPERKARPVPGPDVTMLGTVLDNGRPVEGASVSVMDGDTRRTPAVTDARGRFSLERVHSGPQRVLVCAPPDATHATERRIDVSGVDAGDPDIRLSFTSTRSLRLRWLDAETNEPVTIRRVSVDWTTRRLLSTAKRGTTSSAGDGATESRIQFAAEGTYDMTVTADGRPVVTLKDVEITDDRETVVDVPVANSPR